MVIVGTYIFKRSIKMSYITDTFDVIVVGAGHADDSVASSVLPPRRRAHINHNAVITGR